MRLRWAGSLVGVFLLAARASWAVAPPFSGVTVTTVPSLEDPAVIPDETSLVSLLFVDLVGEVVDVDVTLDITHPSANQLDVYLISPLGTTVALTTDNGGGFDDVFAGTLFDDQAVPAPEAEPGTAAPHVRSITYEDFVVVGPVQPEGALGAMFGDPAGGPWALVVSDDGGGSIGTLNGWSLTLTTMTGVPPSEPPAVFTANGPIDLPDGDSDGVEVPVTVSGLSGPLLDIDAVIDVDSTRASDLDCYLTSPSGRKIELVTDIGGDADTLWAGTTFDDDALEPVSDMLVPDDGSTFSAAEPEGAMGAFLGENGNGTWTLTIADDSGGEASTLQSWSLRLVVPARCGNGVTDPGEECDDGNGGNGDGCDEDCRPSACGNGLVGIDEDCDDGNTTDGDGCTSLCMFPELICDDCVDNDGNGRTDLADPSCGGDAAVLKRVKVSKKGALNVRGKAALPFLPVPGPIRLVVSDASGNTFCATLPDAVLDGFNVISSAPVGTGTVTVILPTKAPGKFIVKGTGLDLSMITDKKTLSVGLVASSHNLFGSKGGKGK